MSELILKFIIKGKYGKREIKTLLVNILQNDKYFETNGESVNLNWSQLIIEPYLMIYKLAKKKIYKYYWQKL